MDAKKLTARQVALLALIGAVVAVLGVAVPLSAPKPLNVALGLVFVFIGVALALYRWLEGLSAALFALAFLIFAGLFNYVAFWPGKRSFAVSINNGTFEPTGELGGRLAFGAGALLLDAIVLFVILLWVLHARRKG